MAQTLDLSPNLLNVDPQLNPVRARERVQFAANQYAYALAACALAENSQESAMPGPEQMQFMELAQALHDHLQCTDEPRFSLYDYLDALLNPPAWAMGWHELYEKFMQALKDKDGNTQDFLFQKVVHMAEAKRETYSA